MKKSFGSILLLLCSVSVYAESITWFSFTRPPWFMENGMGYGDRMQERYISLLPQYQHETLVVNLARMNTEMKKGRNFCIAALADLPIFRQHMHMSKTLYLLPRPKIFMRQQTHEAMGRPEALSIKKLAANSDYHMGIIRGAKSFLPVHAADYEGSQHVTIISSSSPIVSILRMVDLGRVDWAADYPHMVQWGVNSGDIKIDHDFSMVDIEEFRGQEIVRSGIACTKNSWGQDIIGKLNKRVQKDTILSNREWVSQWMPNGRVKEEFFRLNKIEFGY